MDGEPDEPSHSGLSENESRGGQEKIGVNGDEVPPVPIPNTEVKLFSADDTWRETAWESKTSPLFWSYGQAVKTPPFHGGNPGSIPGRITNQPILMYRFFLLLIYII